MRIVYFGSGAFGLPTLERLAREHEVVGVVTQPDRPAGRGKALTPTPVGAWAAAHAADTPVWKPENVNEPGVTAEVRAASADAWVVIAFGQKLSPALLSGRFAVNLHASLLPRWRGAAPINHAILAGDAETGVTVITLADRMDAGLILGEARTAIDPSETAGELHDRLALLGPETVGRVLAEQASAPAFGTPGFAPIGRRQDESLVTKAPKLSKEMGWVDFAEPAERCRRRVHGLAPWPGVAVRFGAEPLKLLRVQAEGSEHEQGAVGAPGELLDVKEGRVACGSGTALRLLEVQPSGSRAMLWSDFARGRTLAPGTLVTGRESA